MNKEELLQELSVKINTGEISREEVTSRFGLAPATHGEVKQENSKAATPFSITKVLYVLGAAIVVVGILIFVSQIWNDIGSFGRISVTLGLGFLLTAIGSILLKSKPRDSIGSVFLFIGGVLIPGGAIVTLSELNVELVSAWPVAITFGVIFVVYLLLNSVLKNVVLTFFTITNGTVFVYLVVEAIVGDSYSRPENLYAYLTMMIGAIYLILGHAFRGSWNKKLVGLLYFFGIGAFLGATFSQVLDSVLWQMLYLPVVIGGLFLSVYLKSRSILTMSTFFLILYVSFITSEYFANSIGWPISLVILGFIFIGLGYVSININKRYIANQF